MAHSCGVDREFDITEWPPARLDAVDEVPVDTTGSGVPGYRLRRAFLIRTFDVQVASTRVIMVKKLAVRIAAGSELSAVFVVEDDFFRLQFPDINGKSRAAEMMGAPIGHAAAGVIPERPPGSSVDAVTAAASVGMVWRPGGGAEPPVPVEAVGDRLAFLVAVCRKRANVNVDRLDDAFVSIPAGIDRFPVVSEYPLTAAGYNPTITPGGVDHQLAFTECLGLGLLTVDVLSVAAGLDHNDRVPVIRRGAMHSINVIANHDFAEVVVGFAVLVVVLLVHAVHLVVANVLFYIGNGDVLDIVPAQE